MTDELVDDLDDAVGCVWTVHDDRCISSDNCHCREEADRLEAFVANLRAARSGDPSAQAALAELLGLECAFGGVERGERHLVTLPTESDLYRWALPSEPKEHDA